METPADTARPSMRRELNTGFPYIPNATSSRLGLRGDVVTASLREEPSPISNLWRCGNNLLLHLQRLVAALPCSQGMVALVTDVAF